MLCKIWYKMAIIKEKFWYFKLVFAVCIKRRSIPWSHLMRDSCLVKVTESEKRKISILLLIVLLHRLLILKKHFLFTRLSKNLNLDLYNILHDSKVKVFWEGQKIWKKSPASFDTYLHSIIKLKGQSKLEIFVNFCGFLRMSYLMYCCVKFAIFHSNIWWNC